MKRKTWTNAKKVAIVLEGMKGSPVTEICTSYQISQNQYYKWRNQFLANADKVFEVEKQKENENRLLNENERLKEVIEELTRGLYHIHMELSKKQG